MRSHAWLVAELHTRIWSFIQCPLHYPLLALKHSKQQIFVAFSPGESPGETEVDNKTLTLNHFIIALVFPWLWQNIWHKQLKKKDLFWLRVSGSWLAGFIAFSLRWSRLTWRQDCGRTCSSHGRQEAETDRQKRSRGHVTYFQVIRPVTYSTFQWAPLPTFHHFPIMSSYYESIKGLIQSLPKSPLADKPST
jgi:hypothetical protein